MTPPVLRDLREADLEWMAEAEVAMFGPAAWSLSLIREDYRWGSNRYRAVEVDGALAAYAVYGFEGDAFHLLNIAVLPEHRRAGIARLLLEDVFSEARRLGAADVWLEVAVTNEPARALYESYGFEIIRRRPKYYQPGDIDGLVMRAVLKPFTPRPPGA